VFRPLTRNNSRGGPLVLSSFSRRSPHEAPPHEGLLCWASVFGLPLGQSWAVEGAQEQVDQDTQVSRTPIVAPGSLARKRAPRGSEGSGPPRSSWALQWHASTCAVRGPRENAEAIDTWHAHGWQDKTAADAAVPDASKRHDGTSLHCRGTALTLQFRR
jgi:hypothetical protein